MPILTRKTRWQHVRRGIATAMAVLEHVDSIPQRCGPCREERGLPLDSDFQQLHDTLAEAVTWVEARGDFPPRCPECKAKRYRAEADERGAQRYG